MIVSRILMSGSLMLAGATAFSAVYLMVPDSSSTSGRRVILLDPNDGSVVNPLYIDLSLQTASTPKHALQVENEIWVSDQVVDSIFVYDLLGTYKRTITGQLDNIRGMGYANGTVYVSNDGASNGATADSIAMYDTAGNRLGHFLTAPATSPFAVFEHNGELLVTDSTEHTIRRYTYAGASLGVWHAGAIRFPQQIHRRTNGNLLVAGFSPPAGVYEYDPAGNYVATYASGAGARGAYELGDGGMLYSVSTGVFKIPAGGGAGTLVIGSNAQYIDKLVIPTIRGRVEHSDFEGDYTMVPVTIEIRPVGSTTPVLTKIVNLDNDRAFSFPASLVTGTYDMTAKSSHWLRKKVSSVVVNEDGTTGVAFILLNGDVDDDNEVSIGDYSQLSVAFGSEPGDPNWNPEADLNGDNAVDIGDFAILSQNFGEVGDE
ncbi:MAG TPA: dockerin type I domain-containing protein [Fimbriimonadaceae bacterium]|mgnify:CR=1 FL=1|nr:dockerin type I domain-containing protein [Fimbriimonadaceae bacterium]HRJ96541.1 dockerin type I domain-containing protein [Fimbriimonadaceae bacterium]